jgi:hypothetical protein
VLRSGVTDGCQLTVRSAPCSCGVFTSTFSRRSRNTHVSFTERSTPVSLETFCEVKSVSRTGLAKLSRSKAGLARLFSCQHARSSALRRADARFGTNRWTGPEDHGIVELSRTTASTSRRRAAAPTQPTPASRCPFTRSHRPSSCATGRLPPKESPLFVVILKRPRIGARGRFL